MVTKGIIELSDNVDGLYGINDIRFNVRIPIFESHKGADKAVFSAACVVMPGYIPNYQAGDVVYVTFEDNNLRKPVIIGNLYLGQTELKNAVASSSLTVTNKANLPEDTTFGDDINIKDLSDRVKELENNSGEGGDITLYNL